MIFEVQPGEFAVEELLEEAGGGDGVELLFLSLAGELFTGALAVNQGLLGVEGAEALVDVEDGEVGFRGELLAPCEGGAGLGAERVVHVEGEAQDDALD